MRCLRVSILFFASVACGNGSPEPVTPKPQASVMPPSAAPMRARWVFSSAEKEIRGKLDLGDHKTLYVGEHGRRELEAGGDLQHAATLAEEALGGVMRDDKGRFVFVATDGDTYVSTEPLGPIERLSAARTTPLASVSAGKAAIVGLDAKGLVRSTDFGKTWSAVAYAGKDAHAASVVLDGKGNGLLLHLPQRIFVTHDDGATWAPIAAPPRGAAKTLRDGADRIFVFGYHDQAATLTGDKLTETGDAPAAIFPGQELHPQQPVVEDRDRYPRMRMRPPIPLTPEDREPLRILAGDRVVDLALKDGKVELRATPLGDKPGAAAAKPELDAGALDPNRIAAWNGEIAYLAADSDDDEGESAKTSPTSTVVRSKDFGATWKKEDAFPGVPRRDARAIAVGPRGWMYVATLCAKGSECKGPKIKPAGKTAFEDVGSDVDLDLRTFLFDEAHDKVYALAEGTGGSILYEGSLGSAKLTRTNVLVAARPHRVAMTVDGQGSLRIFDHAGGHVTLHERSAKGEERAARYVEIGEGTIAFAGKRGLSIGNHASYETNDSGDTWTRVPSNGSTSGIECGAAGCLLRDAQRVGWDLPAVQSTEIVRATTTAPTEPPKTTPPGPKAPIVTPVKIACTATGKGAQVDEYGDTWIGTGAARWARVSNDYGLSSIGVTWADKDTVHRASLFGPSGPSTMETRTATTLRDDGIIGARYRFTRRSASGKLNPVQVELAWWSPGKPQVRRGTLAAVKPFRVSRFSLSGRAQVLDGGILFQGSPSDVLYFVHDDGKSETLASPGIELEEAWHSGKRWVLLDIDDDVIETASSDDGGKTWALHGWAFGPISSREGILETMNGKPVMRVGDALYEVASPVAADPPAGVAIDTTALDARCDGLAIGTIAHQEHVVGDSPVDVDLGGATYQTADRVLHDSATGKLCTSVYLLEQGRDKSAYVYPDKGGGWSGWMYSTKDDKTLATPLACK